MSAPKPPQKPINMEQRLLLAFGIMAVVLGVTSFLTPQPQPAPKPPPVQKQAETPKPAPVQPAVPSRPGVSQAVSSAKEERYAIETQHYKVSFSNQGATVRSWILKGFTDSTGKPLELVNQRAAKLDQPFAVRFHVNQPSDALNGALYSARVTPTRSIEFEFSDGKWYARKSFVFRPDSHLVQVISEVRYAGTPKPHLLYWRGGFGDATVLGAAASQLSVRYDLDANEYLTLLGDDAQDTYQAHRGRFQFAGISDAYFAAVALPETGAGFEIHTLGDRLPTGPDNTEAYNAGVAIGGDPVNRFSLFVGPKDSDLLRSVSPRLEQLVDFGYFTILAKPLFLALHYLNDRYFNNYGWTIVLITIIINFLLLPLKLTSLRSMKKMSAIQPELKVINEKYKGMSIKDPRKQKQNEEVMGLYKKHGVNPMSGCFPMLIQIPFFIAFYKVLSAAIELRGASWLWVSDLSRPEDIPIRILPIAMIITQFILQKMTPATSPDPAQQRIMLMMPLFLGFMFYGVSSGLVLYWLTGNLVGIAQQWFFNRMSARAPATVPPAATKKSSRK